MQRCYGTWLGALCYGLMLSLVVTVLRSWFYDVGVAHVVGPAMSILICSSASRSSPENVFIYDSNGNIVATYAI